MKMFELLPKPLGDIFRKLTHFTCNSPRNGGARPQAALAAAPGRLWVGSVCTMGSATNIPPLPDGRAARSAKREQRSGEGSGGQQMERSGHRPPATFAGGEGNDIAEGGDFFAARVQGN